MKNVPVRRGTLPRLPAPPEVHPGVDTPQTATAATIRAEDGPAPAV
jgi:hypothetical protein